MRGREREKECINIVGDRGYREKMQRKKKYRGEGRGVRAKKRRLQQDGAS